MARPVKKTAEEWKAVIMTSAQKLFLEKGFDNTSISDIMIESQGAKGLFYSFFKTKDELLTFIVNVWADEYTAEIKAVLTKKEFDFRNIYKEIITVIEVMSQKTIGLEHAFSSANFLFMNMLTNRITSILIPLLADTLERGNKEGKLKIESPALCAKFIIFGSLGVLNSGDNIPSENIKNNLGKLQNFISDILHLDVGKGVTDER